MAADAEETSILIGARSPEERKRILGDLFTGHRDRLHAMVGMRLDHRLRARLDTSDILQDAYLEAQRRLDQYLASSPMPFYLWLRRITAQKLIDVQRFHLGQRRDAEREVNRDACELPPATSEAMAVALVARGLSPSEEAARGELKARIEEALERMGPEDREMIALRHFEELSGPETAQVLGIGVEAARKRYLRALEKLKQVLSGVPGGPWGL
jgi:RNA polymerase sigma-70 factor (ECF subfamily)